MTCGLIAKYICLVPRKGANSAKRVWEIPNPFKTLIEHHIKLVTALWFVPASAPFHLYLQV